MLFRSPSPFTVEHGSMPHLGARVNCKPFGLVSLLWAVILWFSGAAGVYAALPTGWVGADLGVSQPSGLEQYEPSASSFTLSAAGADIWGASDQGRYTSREWQGDGTWTVKVSSLVASHPWAKAGIMVRDSLAADSPHVYLCVTPGNGVALQHRSFKGGASSNINRAGIAVPQWLRLIRRESQFEGYYSDDGETWVFLAAITAPLATEGRVGFALTSHRNGSAATVTLTDFSAESGLPADFPAGWISEDVGNPTLRGSADYSLDAQDLRVRGAGADIWGAADQYQFVHREWTGDFTLVARIESFSGTDAWAKAGLMVRADTSAGSRNVFLAVTPGNGVTLQRRLFNGGSTVHTRHPDLTGPRWLKIERFGSRIDAYHSADGMAWIYAGSRTLVLPLSARIGIAVTSHRTNTLAEAVVRDLVCVAPALIPGLKAEYHDGRGFNAPVRLSRIDAPLDFALGNTPYAPGHPSDLYSVRWTGELVPFTTGVHVLSTISDDGIRLWLDDELLIDNWTLHGATEDSVTVSLEAGRAYPLRIEYFEHTGSAVARLLWTPPGGVKAVVPPRALRPGPLADTDGDGIPDIIDPYPNDYYNNTPPTLVIVGGDGQVAAPGEFNPLPLEVAVWDASGSSPLVNAPLSFRVIEGAGGLADSASTEGPEPASELFYFTDVDGAAGVFFRQPATPGITSLVRVTAGTASLVFNTTSAGLLDSDDDGLPDQWEVSFGLNPLDPSDAAQDSDGDHWINLLEYRFGRRPDMDDTDTLSKLAAGYGFSLLHTDHGLVQGWGLNLAGQTGNAPEVRFSPRDWLTAVPPSVVEVAAGHAHAYAVTKDGLLHAWGDNEFGQLGDGTRTSRWQSAPVPGLTGIVHAVAGDHHGLALRGDGTVWAWGANHRGQLGDGTLASRATPALVVGPSLVIRIAVGAHHSAALGADGSLWVWGDNEFGQLGRADVAYSSSPLLMPAGPIFDQLVSGRHHVAGATVEGRLWLWGANYHGQLGDGQRTSRIVKTLLPGASDVTQIAAGARHTFALGPFGMVSAWGANERGQLGLGTTADQLTPAPVSAPAGGAAPLLRIAAGVAHGAALATDGTVFVWGDNRHGRLGLADPEAASEILAPQPAPAPEGDAP